MSVPALISDEGILYETLLPRVLAEHGYGRTAAFTTETLGAELWSKQVEVMDLERPSIDGETAHERCARHWCQTRVRPLPVAL